MQPMKMSPLTMFSQPLQYLVPIFQRGYVWTIERQIRFLWADIVDRANALQQYLQLEQVAKQTGAMSMLRQPRRHFLGTVVISEHRPGLVGEPTTAEVIDGQQRMTTTQLLALAFRDVVSGVEDEFYRTCLDSYTWNAAKYREPESSFKVWPTNAGRSEMSALVRSRSFRDVCKQFPVATIGSGRSVKRVPRPLLVEAYLYFFGAISYYLRGVDLGEEVNPEPGSLEALTDKALSAAGQVPERTLETSWMHQIRHETEPQLLHEDKPLQTARIDLLLATLTEYIQLIELRLGQDDDAQVIFESLNDRGERLTAADLVRNFVFLEAARNQAVAGKAAAEKPSPAQLYEAHWRDFDEAPAEKGVISKSKLFWKVEERQGRLTNTRLDTLLYHYVSMRTGDDIKLDHVFQGFKQWWQSQGRDVDGELGRLGSAAAVFRSLVLPDRKTVLGRFAHNMRVLDSSTMMPAVLHLAEVLGSESEEFLRCLRVLESYLVRRAVCLLPTKAYNRVFPALLKSLQEGPAPTAALVEAHLKKLVGETQAWPDDAVFRKAWTESETYRALRPARAKMILEALELGSRNATHHELTHLPDVPMHVEHILPVAWEEHWPVADDDVHASSLRNHLLHNIGNLTLLTAKLNPSLSNRGFEVKQPEITKSLLALNAHFQRPEFVGPAAAWNEVTIRVRAERLFVVAARVWPFGLGIPS